MPIIAIKRVYQTPEAADGRRILVDRVWPRGITKARLRADLWLKSVAPSTALRNWFKHDRSRWNRFKERYFFELEQNPEGMDRLVDAVKNGPVTLLYSAKETRYNQAVALKEYLSARLRN
ncbi:MAG: DUF488 domain-containing protein [Candidatus Binatia bacterium]